MYEYQTFETILERLLSNEVLTGLDKREGSVIYNALAPAAAELAKLYVSLDIFFQETFADTASLQYLILRAAERGITRKEATSAIVLGEFSPASVDVLNKRFTCNDLIYIVMEEISTGKYRLECETKGEAGNLSSGILIPVDFIQGLEVAQITALITPGEDDESTEALRQRFMTSLNPVAYGGNVADYKAKVGAITGVGGVKVHPVWNGGGTVKLAIISSSYSVPSDEQVNEIQTEIDPTQNNGEGLGIAPIGHVVTVVGVTTVTVNIGFNITYSGTWTWADLEPQVRTMIDDYFLELAQEWADSDSLVVRITQIESRMLELDGVLDVANTTINGNQSNLTLGADEIPVRGSLSG